MLSPYLSVWEVAHRWCNIDPNKTDPENISIEIQDKIRFLCRAVLNGKLYLVEEIFVSSRNDSRYVRNEGFIYHIEEIPSAYEDSVAERKYNKKILDSYLVSQVELFNFTSHENHPFPDFWWDDSIIIALGGHISEPSASSKEQKIFTARTSVIDKSICQAVAKTLWSIDPNINITKMTQHPSVLNYGGGKNYLGKNTLRDWLRDVAPEHIKNKRGRPATKKASIDEA